MWFLYALLSALLASFRKVNDKHLSHTVHHLHLAWMTKVATVPILGLLALMTDQLTPTAPLNAVFWVSILLCVFVTAPIDTAVYLHSLKHGQLSKTAPLMVLWPAAMLVSGAIFLGQIPSVAAVAAVLTIIAGVYVLNTSNGSTNMLRNIWGDRGTRFGLIGVGTVSLNTTLGAIAIAHSAPLFCAFWSTLGAILVQFVYAQVVAPGNFRQAPMRLLAQNGMIQGVATALYLSAVAIGPLGYVAAVRSLSAPFSAVLGARVFKEGMGRRKITALCLITLGALLLGLVS